MIKTIKIKDKQTKDTLLFEEVQDIKQINILFGGNGVGKTTFLNAIRDNKAELILDNDQEVLIKSFTNSIDNMKINREKKELSNSREFVKLINSNGFSEGQSVIHYVLSFLHDIGKINTDKQIVVLLDEIDSGLSAENINMLLWQLKDLMETKNVQFFISSNHYHFAYAFKIVLNMYDGSYIKINSYDDFFNLLNDGIQIMKNSNKRTFNFLDVY